jgi:sugar phosphate isomerase/epimerase
MCWPRGLAERRYAGVTHIDVDALDNDTVEKIRSLSASTGIRISGLGYYPNPLDPDPEKSTFYLSHIKKIIEAASRLDVPVMNTFIGRNPSASIAENIRSFREKWPPIVQYAGDKGIRIGIENCPMYFTQDEWPGGKNLAVSPAVWDEIFSIIPDPHFGLNYDPSHFVWQMMDPMQPMLDYASRLHHIHLKDAKLFPEKLNRVGIMATPLEYHAPRLPGRGEINWKTFFHTLTLSGYRGPVCIEVEDKDFEGRDEDIVKAIRMARDHIKQSMEVQ